MYGKACLSASVAVTYTNNGHLRDAHRRVTGSYGSLIAVDQGAWRLEGYKDLRTLASWAWRMSWWCGLGTHAASNYAVFYSSSL
jgi:hypothetical protein